MGARAGQNTSNLSEISSARIFSTGQEICRTLLGRERACRLPDENERPRCLKKRQHKSFHSSLNQHVSLWHIYC